MQRGPSHRCLNRTIDATAVRLTGSVPADCVPLGPVMSHCVPLGPTSVPLGPTSVPLCPAVSPRRLPVSHNPRYILTRRKRNVLRPVGTHPFSLHMSHGAPIPLCILLLPLLSYPADVPVPLSSHRPTAASCDVPLSCCPANVTSSRCDVPLSSRCVPSFRPPPFRPPHRSRPPLIGSRITTY